jgi:GT2 family glycosyltransferase
MKIAAVFATYRRAAAAETCARRLLAQTATLARIYAVDNASPDGTGEALERLAAGAPTLAVLRAPENLGNPGGIALGITRALSEGCDAVWILDDDAWPAPDALERLLPSLRPPLQAACSLVVEPESGELAWPIMIGQHHCHIANRVRDLPAEERFYVRGAWLGVLLPVEAIRRVGPVNAELFLRGEDEEYPARLRAVGIRFECVRGSRLEHPRHRLRWVNFFGHNYFYEDGLPPWKAFYFIRNQVYVRSRYSGSRWEGWCKGVGTVVLALAGALALDDRKGERMRLYVRAGLDGLAGRLGKTVEPGG